MARFADFIAFWDQEDLSKLILDRAKAKFERVSDKRALIEKAEAIGSPNLGDIIEFIDSATNGAKPKIANSEPLSFPTPVSFSTPTPAPVPAQAPKKRAELVYDVVSTPEISDRFVELHQSWPYLDKIESFARASRAWDRCRESEDLKLKALEAYKTSYLRGEEGQFPRFISSILEDPDLMEDYSTRKDPPDEIYETFRVAYDAYPDFPHKSRQSRSNLHSWMRSIPESKRIDFWFACRAYDSECAESDYRFVESWWNFLDRWESVRRDVEARLVMAGPLWDAIKASGLDPGNHLIRTIPDSIRHGAIQKWDLERTIRFGFRTAALLWPQNNPGRPPEVDVESYLKSLMDVKKLLTALPKSLRIKKVDSATAYPGGFQDPSA